MPSLAAKLLKEVRQLPRAERIWLIDSLMGEQGAMSDEALAAWQHEAGIAEPGYDEWFRRGVHEALADKSGDVTHAVAMQEFRKAMQRSRKLKETA